MTILIYFWRSKSVLTANFGFCLRFVVHLVLYPGYSTKATGFMSLHFTYYGQKRTTTSEKVAPSLKLKKVKAYFVQSLLHHLYLLWTYMHGSLINWVWGLYWEKIDLGSVWSLLVSLHLYRKELVPEYSPKQKEIPVYYTTLWFKKEQYRLYPVQCQLKTVGLVGNKA